MTKKISINNRIQISVDEYTLHVLSKLTGIRGKTKPEVANYMLKSWISDHYDELASYKIMPDIKGGKLKL